MQGLGEKLIFFFTSVMSWCVPQFTPLFPIFTHKCSLQRVIGLWPGSHHQYWIITRTPPGYPVVTCSPPAPLAWQPAGLWTPSPPEPRGLEAEGPCVSMAGLYSVAGGSSLGIFHNQGQIAWPELGFLMFLFCFISTVLGIKPQASCMVNTYFTTRLYP